MTPFDGEKFVRGECNGDYYSAAYVEWLEEYVEELEEKLGERTARRLQEVRVQSQQVEQARRQFRDEQDRIYGDEPEYEQ